MATPKARIIAALEHREPDRVPVGEIAIDFPITELALGRPTLYRAKWKEYVAEWEGRRDEIVESHQRDIVDLIRHFELDYLAVPLVPARRSKYGRPEFLGEYTWRDSAGRIMRYCPESGGHAMAIQPIDLTIADLPLPRDPVPVDESRLEAIQHVIKELGDTHFIIGRPPDGSFPWDSTTGTMDEFLVRMLTQPEFVERAVEVRTREAVAYIKAMIEIGCDAVLPGSDYGDNRGPIMGPDLFRRFCLPSLRRMVDAAHAAGGYLIKHSDGNHWAILDDFVAAGVNGWQGIQPRVGMDLRLLKERYGDQLCFFGGVDVDTLVLGTEQDVVDQVKYAIHHAARDGGLVIGSGNTLLPGVRYENYQAMLRAVREFGAYPVAL
ncbi:MAG: hypothetical protein HYY04_18095 [Chloroflexi bacterium]|nr:hypothetical protein [Chloroflexota bacterium]